MSGYSEPIKIDKVITDDRLARVGIYKRYRDTTFENIESRGVPVALKTQYKAIKEYVTNLDDNISNGIGLILMGGVGLLKTTFAIAVMREALERDVNVKILPMVSLIDTILSLKDKTDIAKFEKSIRTTKLLVLDDLGAERNVEWIIDKIDSIVNERYNRMLPTIITTNLEGTDILSRYNPRTLDRLRETTKTIKFDGASNRKTLKRGVKA